MPRVPKSGTHEGIKYNKKRTLIRFCARCGNPFEIIGSEMARQKYCGFTCSEMAHIEIMRNNWHEKYKHKVDKDKEAERARQARNENKWQDNNPNKQIGNIKTPGAPQAEWTTEQWLAYHKKIQQHKKHTLKETY